jgi:predicted metal-binding membrane protein
MTTATPSLRRLTPQAAVLLLLAAVAWLTTVGRAATMQGMTGTMGLGLAAFVGMWALMMAAMMLPSVAPVASMYQRSVRSYRALRLAGFTSGYLLAWAGAGIPAFSLTALAAQLVSDHPVRATAAAVIVFASCGVYQLTPLKSRCLRHCRSPLSLLLHYGGYHGRLRDVRAGAHHGAYCLGCCWSLMALFVVLGVMNLAAMVALAVVVLVEKLWVHGEVLARAVGVAALALAVAVIWLPALAPGLHGTNQMMSMAGS